MKIIVKNDLVDFETPIYMTEEQLDLFVNGMKKIFNDVKTEYVSEQIKEFSVNSKEIIDWKNPKNLLLLTQGLTEEEIAEKIGIDKKHIFAIRLKSANFLLPFYRWAKKKGLTEISEDDIKEFLMEENI
ncbi:MAG: hypothetical protein QW350_00710 [Candidatus Aenigmatarchaeota archaeon]